MTSSMHIGIAGPIATADIAPLIDGDVKGLPKGYAGAPLLASLMTELLRRGHRVSAFTLSGDMPLKRDVSVVAQGKNFSITYCPMRPRAWQPNGWRLGRIVDLYSFEQHVLKHAMIQASPDVIHAHWAYEFALAALATKIPHIVTCHDSPYTIARLNSGRRVTISAYRWLRVLIARKVLRHSLSLTAVSPYMCDEIQALASAEISVVPNPVDDLTIEYAKARVVHVPPRLAMVCNGWDVRKNPEPALLAFSELRKLKPGVELHLFGYDFGPGERAESWCKALKIEADMLFHGLISHHQLLKSLAEFDLLLHPSLEESFGMVIAEAMAMGLPVVAGASSGAVPWVVGENGVLCDVREPNAIMRALMDALDSERYARLSLDGMKLARARFSTTHVVDQYCSLYEQALRLQVKPTESIINVRSDAWKY